MPGIASGKYGIPGSRLSNLAVVLLGLVLVLVGIVSLVQQEWIRATEGLIAGIPLVATSMSLLFAAANDPKSVLCTSDREINRFLQQFIGLGSTAHVASYRLSWLREDNNMQDFLKRQIVAGRRITIFAAGPDDFTNALGETGFSVITYLSSVRDVPRFTFLNLGRRGAERIAVAREGLPNHWIDVYNDRHHPQVIAIARAYIQQMEAAR